MRLRKRDDPGREMVESVNIDTGSVTSLRKDTMISVRYAPDVVAAVTGRADADGLTVSEWLRRATLRALERPAGLVPDSGRRGEPRKLPSSLRPRTFSCPHLSMGNVGEVSCASCGSLTPSGCCEGATMTRPGPDHGTHVRAMHSYAFRSGEWARIKGTAMLPVNEAEPDRACYLVEFDDGVADFWPVDDPAARYEFGFKGIPA